MDGGAYHAYCLVARPNRHRYQFGAVVMPSDDPPRRSWPDKHLVYVGRPGSLSPVQLPQRLLRVRCRLARIPALLQAQGCNETHTKEQSGPRSPLPEGKSRHPTAAIRRSSDRPLGKPLEKKRPSQVLRRRCPKYGFNILSPSWLDV